MANFRFLFSEKVEASFIFLFCLLTSISYSQSSFDEGESQGIAIKVVTLSDNMLSSSYDNGLSGVHVSTDKLDYAPGETSFITACDFELGEAVEFLVIHIDGKLNTGNGHEAWVVTDGGKDDLDGIADGNITTTWYVDPDDSFNSRFELMARGLNSDKLATHVFLDDTPIPTAVSATYYLMTKALPCPVSRDLNF